MIIFQCLEKKCSFRKEYEDAPDECPKCKSKRYRLIFGIGRKRGYIAENPRWSDSLGCTPEEIPEFKKLYPGSEYSPDGRLLIKNRAHKKFEMRRRGYAELD